jgi:hypothetical protein
MQSAFVERNRLHPGQWAASQNGKLSSRDLPLRRLRLLSAGCAIRRPLFCILQEFLQRCPVIKSCRRRQQVGECLRQQLMWHRRRHWFARRGSRSAFLRIHPQLIRLQRRQNRAIRHGKSFARLAATGTLHRQETHPCQASNTDSEKDRAHFGLPCLHGEGAPSLQRQESGQCSRFVSVQQTDPRGPATDPFASPVLF